MRDNRLNWKKGGWGTTGLQIHGRVITWFQKEGAKAGAPRMRRRQRHLGMEEQREVKSRAVWAGLQPTQSLTGGLGSKGGQGSGAHRGQGLWLEYSRLKREQRRQRGKSGRSKRARAWAREEGTES